MIFLKSIRPLLVVALLSAGCDLYPELGDVSELGNSTSKLSYDAEKFVSAKDRDGQKFIRGSGSILHQSKIKNVSSLIKVNLSAKFDRANSELSLHSHAPENLLQGYELRFARVGTSLRLSSTLNLANPKVVGIVLDKIENWDDPIEIIVEIDNRLGLPSVRVWSPQSGGLGAETNVLKETREDGYPEGERMGLRAEGISLYSFTFTEN